MTDAELERKARLAETLLAVLTALRPLSPVARLEVLAETAIEIGAYDVAEATYRRLKHMPPEQATPEPSTMSRYDNHPREVWILVGGDNIWFRSRADAETGRDWRAKQGMGVHDVAGPFLIVTGLSGSATR